MFKIKPLQFNKEHERIFQAQAIGGNYSIIVGDDYAEWQFFRYNVAGVSQYNRVANKEEAIEACQKAYVNSLMPFLENIEVEQHFPCDVPGILHIITKNPKIVHDIEFYPQSRSPNPKKGYGIFVVVKFWSGGYYYLNFDTEYQACLWVNGVEEWKDKGMIQWFL